MNEIQMQIEELKRENEQIKKDFMKYKKETNVEISLIRLNHILALYVGLFFLAIKMFNILPKGFNETFAIILFTLLMCLFLYQDVIIVSKWMFNKIIGVKS